MIKKYQFNRFELSGSLGDLGTLIPIGISMVVVNQLNPSGIFLSAGLFYIIAGWYYGIPISVQPMKVIAAYAIAMAVTPAQIKASCILMILFLSFIGFTGTINVIQKYIPKSAIKGVQLTTGILLMIKGVKFILGTANIQLIKQVSEPFLAVQHIGVIPIGLVIGIGSFFIILFLLDNERIPAGIIVVALGLCIGAFFGVKGNIIFSEFGINMTHIIPSYMPKNFDFSFALITLVMPQIPMTVGNAVIANRDLSIIYFGNKASRVTSKALCITMAFGNLLSTILGGMPLCHGAGGLAAHYRFGARSAGSNIIIGVIFIFLAIFLGDNILNIFNMIPMATLGALLLFSGAQLAITIADVKTREDIFVIFIILAVTLASNFGLGFLSGIVTFCILKFDVVKI